MKKRKRWYRIVSFALAVAMLAGFCPQGVSFKGMQLTAPEAEAAQSISNPRKVEDSSMESGQKVTWDCVYFGSYPQSEITSKDGGIYNVLKDADGWDSNNDITIDGTKYRRLKGEDAPYAISGFGSDSNSGFNDQYDWKSDYKTYHYFKYEPIKWRVLNRNGDDAFLLADVALDNQQYNTNNIGTTWEKSSIRSWLNGYRAEVNEPKTDYSSENFINTAFTTAEQDDISIANVKGDGDVFNEIAGGSDTSDKVFLLSISEVYNTDKAMEYGFVKEDDLYDQINDEARRSLCSTYAYAMGVVRYVNITTNEDYTKYNGNVCGQWLRSPGISENYMAIITEGGGVYWTGQKVDYWLGVRPALHLNLTSSAYSYAGTVCSDDIVSEQENIESVKQQSGEFKFETSLSKLINTSGKDRKTAKYTYDYDENWFFKPSTTYQHGLTQMSIRAAMAGYGVMDKHHSIDTNIKYLMAGDDENSLGFTNYESSYPDPETNTIGYAIASKNIRNSSGDKCSLLMVTVRGGGYMDEWGGNFDLGTRDEHQGFNEAAIQVRDGIKKYVEEYKDELPYDLKVWISGYSRGAATTNLVAKMLDDGAVEGLERDNIYAFCFECPQNTTRPESYTQSDKYKNIVSVVNPIDLVPKVAMSGFGFKRYGTVYQLPSRRTSSGYMSAKLQMISKYNELIEYNGISPGAVWDNFLDGNKDAIVTSEGVAIHMTWEGLGQASMMDNLMDDLCDVAVDRNNYYMRFQANLIDGAATALGENSGFDAGALGLTVVRIVPELAKRHPMDTAYMTLHTEHIARAHYAELCMVWLDSLSGDAIRNSSKTKYKKVAVNCPVDVMVYDENSTRVAEITNNKVADNDDGLEAYIDDNGQKIVCIPEDGEYKVELKATDNGTMTYTVMDQNLETNECSQVKSYVDIPIEKGAVYTSIFETDSEGTVSTEVLTDTDGNEMTPSINKDVSEDIRKQVTVSAQAGGQVIGGGNYTIGEYAKVIAEPDEDYMFDGWYEKNALVSKEKEHRFCVQDNVDLVAHFIVDKNQNNQKPSTDSKPTTKPAAQPSTETKPAPTIKPYKATGASKQIAAGKKVNLKAEIGLSDTITKRIVWKSSNPKVATVNANGIVTVKKNTGGKKAVITATHNEAEVSISWKIISMKGIVKKVKITGTKTVKAGKSLKLKAAVTATKKANKKLQWTSSNTRYATVNNKGVVKTKKTAKGKTVKITATATDGSGKKATIKIKVK